MKRKKWATQRGSGIVEYILITAMVALAAVSIFRTFRADLSSAYKKAGQALIQGVEDGVSRETTSGE